MSRKLGSAVVLSGPSGVGKSTLVNLVRKNMPELEFSVSCTTRQPRPAEEHGVHYYFLSDDEFSRRQENGEFIEHAGVFAKRYGTLRSEVLNRVERGGNVLLDIDVQGAMQIMESAKNDPRLAAVVEFVFIAPPSLAELERRLRGRGTETEEQIALRLSKAAGELSHWRKYEYLLINDEVAETAKQFEALLETFRLKTIREEEELFA